MANVVNNILNKVDMNTTKYNKKLQAMKKDTKSVTSSISKMFKDAFSVAMGIGISKAFSAITNGAMENVKSFERMSASISAWTGDIESAKAKFWELNTLEDETTISTNELAQSFINLKKNGLNSGEGFLKDLSKIAIGMNKSIGEVTEAITKASHGKFMGLQQLGIQAKRDGDSLVLTYQGVTKRIKADTESLQQYFSEMATTNFEQRANTVEGALGRLSNAWGTFQTLVFNSESPIGQAIISITQKVSDFINKVNGALNDPKIKETISKGTEQVKKIFDDLFRHIKDTVDVSLNDTNMSFKDKFEIAVLHFQNFVLGCTSWLEKIFLGLKGFKEAVEAYVVKPLKAVGGAVVDFIDKQKSTLGKASFVDLMNPYKVLGITLGNVSESLETAGQTITETTQNNKDALLDLGSTIDGVNQKTEAMIKANEERINELKKQKNKILEEEKKSGGKGDTGNINTILGGSNGTSIRNKELDKWKSFYSQLENVYQMHTMTALERAKLEHDNQLAELENFHAQGLMSEEEYQKALSAINMQYADEWHRYQDELLKMSVENAKKKNKNLNALGVNEEDFNNTVSGLQSMSDAFGNLTDAMNENSSEYKVVFAMQKAFTVASTTLNCINAWAKALNSTTWYEGLANYASAIAMTTQIISQIKSVSMYDKGGNIPSGAIGIVGEYGPEIVRGPANVTSRKDTEELLSNANSNVVININESTEKAGTVEQSQDNEQTIIDIFVSNIRGGGQISNALQNTYGLKRYGV